MLMEYSVTVFVDEFSKFSTFSVVLPLLGRPEHLPSSSDSVVQKLLSSLRNVLQKPHKAFEGFH
jgi:hypothetical protein